VTNIYITKIYFSCSACMWGPGTSQPDRVC